MDDSNGLQGDGSPLLRVSDAANRCGVPQRTLFRWVAEQVIPPEIVLRVGRAVYLRRDLLLKWLEGETHAHDEVVHHEHRL